MCGNRIIPVQHSPYHGWWRPGSLGCYAINIHYIAYEKYVRFCLTWGRMWASSVMSTWRNDRNYRYMFMFLLKNLAPLTVILGCLVQMCNFCRSFMWCTVELCPKILTHSFFKTLIHWAHCLIFALHLYRPYSALYHIMLGCVLTRTKHDYRTIYLDD